MTKNFAGKHATPGQGVEGLEVNVDLFGGASASGSQTVVRLLRDSDCAVIIGCSKATWWRRVADGTMPQPVRIGSMTRWKLSEVLSAIERLSTPQTPEG